MSRAGRGGARAAERIASSGLEELQSAFPEAWREVGEALVRATASGRIDALQALVEDAERAAAPLRARLAASHDEPRAAAAALPALARARMARLAVERAALAAASGRAEGTVRFGLWDGLLVQRLLFARGLERKPVSLPAFRLLWPLVRRRRILMPLVQPRGIWCFWSRALVRALARLAAGREVLELAAGDGTLARFLAAEGVPVRATDDHSWWKGGAAPAGVERLDARDALARHAPRVVLCSFPPPGNAFERAVFRTRSVETYVVLTTRHRFAAGDWDAYEAASGAGFAGGEEPALSRLLLPPEIDPAVLVFRRTEDGGQSRE